MKGKNAFSAVRLLPLLLAIFLAMPQYVSAKMTGRFVCKASNSPRKIPAANRKGIACPRSYLGSS